MACSCATSSRSLTARPAGLVAPGARVTVTGVFPGGPPDEDVYFNEAATTEKASRQAATNASRPRRLTTGLREARPRRHPRARPGRLRARRAAARPRPGSPL